MSNGLSRPIEILVRKQNGTWNQSSSVSSRAWCRSGKYPTPSSAMHKGDCIGGTESGGLIIWQGKKFRKQVNHSEVLISEKQKAQISPGPQQTYPQGKKDYPQWFNGMRQGWLLFRPYSGWHLQSGSKLNMEADNRSNLLGRDMINICNQWYNQHCHWPGMVQRLDRTKVFKWVRRKCLLCPCSWGLTPFSPSEVSRWGKWAQRGPKKKAPWSTLLWCTENATNPSRATESG